ncbi:trypsin-like peptidase domain-containing protein [Candidatus Poribacteria bacterium]|nr:trypsin-like peptidase domain-containing protein [Candidatus Poribacteria bacterium]
MIKKEVNYFIILLCSAIIFSCATPPSQTDDFDIVRSFENTISHIVKQSKPAIVSLTVEKTSPQPLKNHNSISNASGFIFKKDGFILTNEHVVRKASRITVSLFDGTRYFATLVGRDPNTDIAVIKIHRDEDFPSLSLGDSKNVRIGQLSIAIGDPIGFKQSVTVGIVSGKGRCHHSKSKLFQYHRNYIQTDAWINPGSSGGPLLNIEGEVIGINTLNPGEGASLAINSNLVKTISDKLIADGRIIRGYINAEMQNVHKGIKVKNIILPTNRKKVDLPSNQTLKRNDIIVELDNQKVPSLNRFRLIIADYPIGKQCNLKVLRKNQEVLLNITIDEMPLELVGRSAQIKSESWKTLGLAVRNLENGIQHRYNYLNEHDHGVIVEKIKRFSHAYRAMIPRNALITAINEKQILDTNTLDTYLINNPDLTSITLDIKSHNGTQKVTIPLKNREPRT